MLALLEEGLSIHTIKGISEVDFNKDGTAGIAMPMTPLAGSFQANFCPQGLSNSDLQWEEMCKGLSLMAEQRTLAVSRRKVSPTATGRTPLSFLGRAVWLAPAM